MANERDSAEAFVREVLAACEPFRFKSVTLFAVLDRVSRDGTLDLLRELETALPQLRVVWAPENRCVVDAYLRGYREALDSGCDWVLEIDAGFSHQPSDIPLFFEKMSEGHDCVFGTRFAHGGRITDSSLKREVISRGGTLLTNALLGTRLTDMTSGFELFSRAALEEVLRRGVNSRGHFFQTEIKAHCHGRRVAEVPIHYRAASDSVNRGVLKDAFVNLWRLFRARFSRGQTVAAFEQDEAA
ncbi:MAG: glycosyltransferase [Acidobacteria bacterium]|nr:glycosyltransferase [Acidobacteriota bacterium]